MYREIQPYEVKVDGSKGYHYFIDKMHPLAYVGVGKVYYHRHVASIKLGRWLTTTEVVHHIDEDKSNNHPSNLEVMDMASQGRLHSTAVYLIKTCLTCNKEFEVTTHSTQQTCSNKCRCIQNRDPKVQITKEELEYLIWRNPFTCVGSIIGLSDNGVRRRAQSLGCLMPPARFHTKSVKQRKEIALTFNISL